MNCSRYWKHIIVAIFGVMIFCFWLFLYPFIPVVREMSQLFLWTGDYFIGRIVIPGGLAQYLGEMIGQLFINPMNGAIAYTILFILAQQLLCRWLSLAFPLIKSAYRFALSFLAPAILWVLAMFPQIPLTVTIAIILVLGTGCLVMMVSQKPPFRKRLWVLLPTIPVMYWLAGPIALLLVLCCIRWIPVTAMVFVASLLGSSYLTPYPLRQVAVGIDYMAADNKIGQQMSTYEEMECDMLLRQGAWRQIIRKFPQPESPAVRSAVLLAYHKTGELSLQELMSNLVVPTQRQDGAPSVFNISETHFVVNFGSVSSAFIVSDIAIQLYWINISQRAAFDAMEYIPNYNKSGRALKRLVETNIISGHYDVARKYISILEEALLYRKWAQSMRVLVDNPKLIENNPFLQSGREEYAKTADIFFI